MLSFMSSAALFTANTNKAHAQAQPQAQTQTMADSLEASMTSLQSSGTKFLLDADGFYESPGEVVDWDHYIPKDPKGSLYRTTYPVKFNENLNMHRLEIESRRGGITTNVIYDVPMDFSSVTDQEINDDWENVTIVQSAGNKFVALSYKRGTQSTVVSIGDLDANNKPVNVEEFKRDYDKYSPDRILKSVEGEIYLGGAAMSVEKPLVERLFKDINATETRLELQKEQKKKFPDQQKPSSPGMR